MLAELFLCGLASTNIGLKNLSKDFSQYEADATNYVESMSNIMDDPFKSYSYSAYNGNPNKKNIEYLDFAESGKNNDHISYAEVISPYYDVQEEYVDLDGYKSSVKGSLSAKDDVDYYKFYLYGDASVKISFTSKDSDNTKMWLKKYKNPGDYSKEFIDSSYDSLEYDLKAGAYNLEICDYQNDGSYYFELNVEYEETDKSISMGYLYNHQGVKGTVWISDLDPLGVIPFKRENKTVKYKGDTLEYGFKKYDRILHSSMFIWDKGLKESIKEMFQGVSENVDKELEGLKAEKIRLERNAEIADSVEGVVTIACTFFGMGGVVLKTVSNIVGAVYTALALANYKSGGEIPTSFAGFFEAMIPTGQIMSLENFHHYLKIVTSNLSVGPQDPEYCPVRIDSYYKFNDDIENGEYEVEFVEDPELENKIKPAYDEIAIGGYNKNSSYNALDHVYTKGKFYRLKNIRDFKDAQDHIQHNYGLISAKEITPTPLDSEGGGEIARLTPNGYQWFSFTLNPKDPKGAGSFVFYSSDKSPKNDIMLGALFDRIIVGKDIEDEALAVDYENGTEGHFRIIYYLEPGETVYLRVRGKNWETINDECCVQVERTEHAEWSIKSNDTYYIDKIGFEMDETRWRVLQFETPGYKIIQGLWSDPNSQLKLFDKRGKMVGGTQNGESGLDGYNFLCTYVIADEYYYLKVCSPVKNAEEDYGSISFIAVNEYYSSFDNLPKIKNTYNQPECYADYDLNLGKCGVGVIEPQLTAHYRINGKSLSNYSDLIIEVRDASTGDKIKKAFRTKENDCDVWCLYSGKKYLITVKYSEDNIEGKIRLFTTFYLDDEYVIPSDEDIKTITVSDMYYEDVIMNLKTNEYTDMWFKFTTTGYRVFQLFGNYDKNSLEIYEMDNKLLGKDNNTSGTSSSAFVCAKTVKDEIYRVRIRNNTSRPFGNPVKFSISRAEKYYENFKEMTNVQASTGSYGMKNRLGSVGYFVANSSNYHYFETDYFSKISDLNIVDVTSSDYNEPKDGTLYDNETYKLLKKLEIGKTYFISLRPGYLEIGSKEFELSVYDIGYEVKNADEQEDFDYKNILDFGDKNEVNVIYKAKKTGTIVVDPASCNTDLDCGFRVTGVNIFKDESGLVGRGDVYNSRSLYATNNSLKIFDVVEGAVYRITIKQNGSLYAGEKAYLKIYDCDYQSDTEKIVIDDYKSIDSCRYYERIVNINPGKVNYIDFVTYECTSCCQLVQTMGSLNVEMEVYGPKLIKRSGKGYCNNAFLVFKSSSYSTYTIAIKGANNSVSGPVKLTITPVSLNCENYTSFEDIETISGVSGTFNYQHTSNLSNVVKFIPSEDGSYSFDLDYDHSYKSKPYSTESSSPNTYLYVVDPELSKLIPSEDYDDNSNGNLQAGLSKELKANHAYFIVCAMSEPSILYNGPLTLSISKEPETVNTINIDDWIGHHLTPITPIKPITPIIPGPIKPIIRW